MSTKSVYQMVTERVIENLENGIVPWLKPWVGANCCACNGVTGKPYSLLNQMLLDKAGRYMTFNQVSKRGGKIKSGSKGSFVVFWKPYVFKEKDEETGEEIEKSVQLLRYYYVFHESQIEGIEFPQIENKEVEPIEEAERIRNEYKTREGIVINETLTDNAFYSPTKDYIQVPQLSQFSIVGEFYSTLFHEMVHSTGHKTRLGRFNDNANVAFGSEAYSMEELIAEMGSIYLMNICGIETEKTFKNSVAYIQGWLKVLKRNVRFIVDAASRANKAVNYILGKQTEESEA